VVAQLFNPLSEVSSASLITLHGFLSVPSSRHWTKEELTHARQVIEFIKRLAFESYSSIYQAVKNGSISNIPFTHRDVINAEQIHGPLIPALKGKSVSHNINLRDVIPCDKLNDKQVALDIDIFYCEQFPFLLSLSDPIKL
jgi:hypothetical protein